MKVIEVKERVARMRPICETIHFKVDKNPPPAKLNSSARRFGLPAPKPERQKEVDFILPSVHATFYDTGLLSILIFDADTRSRRIQITNTRGIYESGHVEEFLHIIQEINTTSKINFANFRSLTVEYNEAPHGETFRALVDSPDLPEVSKFAAIWSTLHTSSDLETEVVLKIAKHQQSPITEDGTIYFGKLDKFILPYYTPYPVKEQWPNSYVSLNKDNYSYFFMLIGFLNSEDEEQTFEEYSKHNQDNLIESALGSTRVTAEIAMDIYNDWGSISLNEATVPLLQRLAKIPTHDVSKELRKFLLDRLLSGDRMLVEVDHNITSNLTSFFTMSEYVDFFAQLSESHLNDTVPESMGPLSLEVIVYYYLQHGFSKVLELLDMLHKNRSDFSSFFYSKTVFDMQSPVRQKLKFAHFKLLLDETFKDMPVGWAISLISAEIEAEKQEKAKKINSERLLEVAA